MLVDLCVGGRTALGGRREPGREGSGPCVDLAVRPLIRPFGGEVGGRQRCDRDPAQQGRPAPDRNGPCWVDGRTTPDECLAGQCVEGNQGSHSGQCRQPWHGRAQRDGGCSREAGRRPPGEACKDCDDEGDEQECRDRPEDRLSRCTLEGQCERTSRGNTQDRNDDPARSPGDGPFDGAPWPGPCARLCPCRCMGHRRRYLRRSVRRSWSPWDGPPPRAVGPERAPGRRSFRSSRCLRMARAASLSRRYRPVGTLPHRSFDVVFDRPSNHR